MSRNHPWADCGNGTEPDFAEQAFKESYQFGFLIKWLEPIFRKIFYRGWDAAILHQAPRLYDKRVQSGPPNGRQA